MLFRIGSLGRPGGSHTILVAVGDLWFYVWIIGYMWAGSAGLPAPEEPALLGIGHWVHEHPDRYHLGLAMLAAFFGMMSGDTGVYLVGRKAGVRVVDHPWARRLISPAAFASLSAHFRRRGFWTVLIGRFIPGVRSMVFLAAGATRYPAGKFLLANGSAALVTVPLFIYLGYKLSWHVERMTSQVEQIKWVVLVLLGLTVVFVLVIRLLRRALFSEAGPLTEPSAGNPPHTPPPAPPPRSAPTRPAGREADHGPLR